MKKVCGAELVQPGERVYKKDVEKIFSIVHSDRTRGNSFKTDMW